MKKNLIQQIFQEAHSEIDFSNVLSLTRYPSYQPEGFEELAQMMEADLDGFYLDPEGILHLYFYFKDGFFYCFNFLNLAVEKEILASPSHSGLSEVARFRAQKKWLMEKKEEDISLFLLLSDKRVRFRLFEELFDQIPDENKFDTFMSIYTSAEYGFSRIDPDFIRSVFSYRAQSKMYRPFRELFPDAPDCITIYRGATAKSSPFERAYSWTLNPNVAEFFATRFKEKGSVHEAHVQVEHVIAYCNDRQEEEVLIAPEHIIHLTKEQRT